MIRILPTLLSILLFFTSSVFAQNIPDNVSRQSERLQEREIEQQRQREEDLRARQQVAPSGTPVVTPDLATVPSGECVTVMTATIKGVSIYPEDEFTDVLQSIVGTCIFVSDIDAILRAITNRYIKDGYVTSRALIAPQDLDDGSIEIVVIEGQLADIRAEQDKIGNTELRAAFPGLKNEILNLRDIEQGIDQMLRLPSFDPSIDIEPATAQGASNLILKRKKSASPVRPSLSFNNDGQVSTGRLLTTLSVDVDNITGLLDFTSLYFSRDLGAGETGGTQSFGGFLSIPRGYWTISVSGGYSEYDSIISGNGQSFVSDGETYNGSATLERLFFRDADTKLSVAIGLNLFDTVNRIQGIRLSTSSYRLVNARASVRLQQRLPKGLLNAGLGFVQGFDFLGAQTVDTGPGGPGTNFSKITANISYREPFLFAGVRLQYALAMRGQVALTPVFPAQRISIGGSSTVRGFKDDGNSGRTGATVRQQLSGELGELFASLSSKAKSKVLAFAAYDAGGVAARSDNPFERGFLHSATVGLQLVSKLFAAEFAVSIPVSAPSFVRRRDAEFGANLRFNF